VIPAARDANGDLIWVDKTTGNVVPAGTPDSMTNPRGVPTQPVSASLRDDIVDLGDAVHEAFLSVAETVDTVGDR
jgi:hypothetical protein